MKRPQYINDRVLALWVEGFTAEEIVHKVPNQGFTRSSVLGTIHRINAKRKAEGLTPLYRKNITQKQVKLGGDLSRVLTPKVKPRKIEPVVKSNKFKLIPKVIHLERVESILNTTGCRFFVKDVCCNKPLYNNSMWCEKHYSIVYDRTKTANLNSNRALRRFR